MFRTKLFKDSSYVFISDGLLFGTWLLWGILLARWLGAEYLGIFYYYVGIFSIAASIGEFGKIGHLMR